MVAGVTPWQTDITKSNCLSCAALFHISHKSPLCYSFKVKPGWPRSPHLSCKERDNCAHHTFSLECHRMEWQQGPEWLEGKGRGIRIWIQLVRCVGVAQVFIKLHAVSEWLFILLVVFLSTLSQSLIFSPLSIQPGSWENQNKRGTRSYHLNKQFTISLGSKSISSFSWQCPCFSWSATGMKGII